jgi:HAD superfamily hydrolase (TIGR01509 family)
MNPNSIKAVIFDWGGVCCSGGEPFALTALQQAIGKHPDDICAEVKEVCLDYYRGKYTNDEFYSRVLDYFGLQQTDELNPDTLGQAYVNSYTLWQDVLDTVKALQAKYKIALLSDLTPIMMNHIRSAHNTAAYFPLEVYSNQVGMVKDDGPEIFHHTTAKLGVEPEVSLFIDNSKSKIDVAKKAGLHTMLFESREQFHRDIEQYLKT